MMLKTHASSSEDWYDGRTQVVLSLNLGQAHVHAPFAVLKGTNGEESNQENNGAEGYNM